MASATAGPQRRLENPAIFICDIQEKFRNAIWEFDKVVFTTQKVLRAAQTLKIPVYVTTQNAAKLGATVPEVLSLASAELTAVNADKTGFSMLAAAELAAHFGAVSEAQPRRAVAIVGIESHVCVTQTALDLLARGHRVYVLADGVSSCNAGEVAVALARLRAEGARVTTSESWLYECMGDAAIPEFRDVARLVKESVPETRAAVQALLGKI
ncbi:isochorismatase [Durotheca rogersii]|uniref:isochorismatase n=1 Tax=Durotheca rogersii TaxID=419775 RepID=UPI00221F2297|nr:isochorismatase [Durotheca rogersii]KAI5863112.1 isochorismatase [Durotheca rogersii]